MAAVSDDPGWRPALVVLVPFLAARRARREPNAIIAMRLVFLSFVNAIVLFGVVIAFLQTDKDKGMAPVFALAAYAVIATIASRFAERPLDCASPTALVASYRTRMFTRIAFAESVALLAFVLQFSTGPRWIYYVGAAYTLTWFALIGPTGRGFAHDQAALDARGCDISLVAALAKPARPSD